MRSYLSMVLLVTVIGGMPLVFAGCEESHSETTKQGMFGGQTHEETTVTKNPITGDTSVEHEKQTTH